MGNVQDKVNWCAFLADARFDIIVDNLLEGAQIVIGGGFKNAQSLDLQLPPGESRLVTLEYWQLELARLQAMTRRLKARSGDWTGDSG
ncbi:hypothetical protein LSAT2_014733, partial [Lamellibrachia satsuma]